MIYLDHSATTRTHPEVIVEMVEVMKSSLGNPSSLHQMGQKAQKLLCAAKERIRRQLGLHRESILFTSGATEALNMVIQSVQTGRHLITSRLEHPATLAAAQLMEKRGVAVTYLEPKAGCGAIEPSQVEEALCSQTSLIAIMGANNETGVKSDVDAISEIARRYRISYLCDGVGRFGKEAWSLPEAIICLSGHKIYGPRGVGVLIVPDPSVLQCLICGGSQQLMLRGGTENLAAIVGCAKAIELLDKQPSSALRDYFEKQVVDRIGDVVIHGEGEERVTHLSNIGFLGVDGETLAMQLDLAGIAVSHGAACQSHFRQPSHVLQAMHVPPAVIRSSIRFSLGATTTRGEIDQVVTTLYQLVRGLRFEPVTSSKMASSVSSPTARP